MADKEMPDYIYYLCPSCDEVTEHDILKAKRGKDNITGTFRCRDCLRTFNESIKMPKTLEIPVLFSDGKTTEKTQTKLESNEIVAVGDEFYLDDGRRVCVTLMDADDGKNHRKLIATRIKKLWVKTFDVLNVKISVNDNRRTIPLRIDAEPDDEFTVGMMLSFENFNALVHAIKTTDRLVRRGSAEAREIRRIYAKIRPKQYDVMDFSDDDLEFDESEYEPQEEDL